MPLVDMKKLLEPDPKLGMVQHECPKCGKWIGDNDLHTCPRCEYTGTDWRIFSRCQTCNYFHPANHVGCCLSSHHTEHLGLKFVDAIDLHNQLIKDLSAPNHAVLNELTRRAMFADNDVSLKCT